MKKFKKQIYEEFFVHGSILNVQNDDETIVEGTSDIVAVDNVGTSATADVLDVAGTKTVGDDPNGSYTNNVLSVRVKAGTEALSPYKITFKIVTSAGNKYEIDMQMTIKEI